MDVKMIRESYDSYKTYKQAEKEAKSVKHNFDMAVQGVTSTYTFTQHGDVKSLHKMIESMNFFIAKNPIGKLMVKYYEPHFKLLEAVWDAVTANENVLTKALDDLEKEITKFGQDAPAVITATDFPKSELQQGPISYSLYLGGKENAFGDESKKQVILSFVNLIKARAESIVHHLDKLLADYANLGNNYGILYDQVMDMYKTNQEGGGLKKAFADKAEGFRWLVHETDYSVFRGRVNSLIKNRNDWADWLGTPKKLVF